jgi:Flp pilus assembly protein TadD
LQAFRRYLRRALALQPTYALAHDGLGVALQGAGEFAEALEHYGKAVRLDPANANARTHASTLEQLLGDAPGR